MSRVAVCIGVDAPGLLAPLRSCAKSAEEFGSWLKSKQDFDDVRILTDLDRSKGVNVALVKQAISEVLNVGPTQCVVYFSGHGQLNGGSETWLLSNAVDDQAIDLTASREQSRLCRVPHIIFISDACRALPADYGASMIRGASIFPNQRTVPVEEGEVDTFFAAPKSGIALEVPSRDGKSYRSLFTDVFMRSFINPPDEITARVVNGHEEVLVVTNRRLKPYLRDRVLDEAEQFFPGRAQSPVIRLESNDTCYIGRVEYEGRNASIPADDTSEVTSAPQTVTKQNIEDHAMGVIRGLTGQRISRNTHLSTLRVQGKSQEIAEITARVDDALVGLRLKKPSLQLRRDCDDLETVGDLVDALWRDVNASFPYVSPIGRRELPEILIGRRPAGDPSYSEISAHHGFDRSDGYDEDTYPDETIADFATVSGIEINVVSPSAVSTSGSLVLAENSPRGRTRWHFSPSRKRPPSIAIGFAGGGTVVTCIPDFVTSVTILNGRVSNISFIPAQSGTRWQQYTYQSEEIERLRATVSASARLGRLEVGEDGARNFADKVRMQKGLDPALGLYAAYAYAEVRAIDEIESVRKVMRGSLGFDLFDLDMLAMRYERRKGKLVAPFCPMLSQGWSYALAYRKKLPNPIRDARLLPSLWTTFDDATFSQIFDAVRVGELE